VIQNDTYLQTLYPEAFVNPASIDLRLDQYALIFDQPLHYRLLWRVTRHPRWLQRKRTVDLKQGYYLKPGQMALVSSQEVVYIPEDMSALLTLKSSRGREGLNQGFTGWFDPGFIGSATFPLYAPAHPVRLQAGVRMAQLIYLKTHQPHILYNGAYQHQAGPTESYHVS
jgi:deoxycytidine triphosphate deaminase